MSAYGLLRPALFAIDPERAHRLTIRALTIAGGMGAVPRVRPVTIAGIEFPNPVGLAAGMDKDGEAIAGLFGLGFGAVEIGSLTPRPQSGNPKPRLFRLAEDRAVVNRMGFNNGGIDAALERVKKARRAGVLGINVGANKDSDDRVADYALGVGKAARVADYVTINVSSPNTPGLRDLQSRPALDELLAASNVARMVEGRRVPLFLKVAPDLDTQGFDDAVRAAIDNGIDALIVGNTTISRPATLRSAQATQTGGLSGAPLKALARTKLAEALASSGGQLPVIAVGGIDSPEEALARLEAGAALVQLYSALVYEGPGLVRRILKRL
ncbi:quinone-dependent dihydroorotate dehydrogenase [Sphingomonas sp. BT-65]|uniref:quinone-dependent dihydroorotate dehydrogenase n=1 Tax=Sphingomonas sp. BT-65 TaxID=2989821 RepID=UPI002236B2BC|nr:quinone-dependent dihydroorotate dehydrogenase [Sphingomonas sp. BT-65]MCW4463263.1 quinone-dependent dihydroorotate dehydrogenase [Sphingomonas sp. BT-65]